MYNINDRVRCIGFRFPDQLEYIQMGDTGTVQKVLRGMTVVGGDALEVKWDNPVRPDDKLYHVLRWIDDDHVEPEATH